MLRPRPPMPSFHKDDDDRDWLDGLPAEPISVRIPVASRLTGLSRSRIFELIQSGDLESVKLGKARLILFRSLKRLIEGA